MEEDLILAKATLISGGAVRVPKGYRIPVRISRSTAGPGAGSRSVVFSFGGMRIKKAISTEQGEFFYDPDERTISKGGEVIVRDVSISPVAFHCPEQAFFNLEQRCIFNCLFCPSPHLRGGITDSLDGMKITSMIRQCKEPIHSIALTSGVRDTVNDTVDRMVSCVSVLREEFPDLTIGVEPYVDDFSQIDRLFEAGASEIKINVETATDELFEVFCPSLDRNNIFTMLAHAIDVFGRNKVSSNIIFGLGETDDDLRCIMERLCLMGVTPTLRGLRINGFVAEALAKEGIIRTPSPERLVSAARMQKEILERYGLDIKGFDTMCLRCTCCDLVPFTDL